MPAAGCSCIWMHLVDHGSLWQTPSKMAYKDLFSSWGKLASVTPVVSKPEGTGWAGRTGYVQVFPLYLGVTVQGPGSRVEGVRVEGLGPAAAGWVV